MTQKRKKIYKVTKRYKSTQTIVSVDKLIEFSLYILKWIYNVEEKWDASITYPVGIE